MKTQVFTGGALACALLFSGCATKKYVSKQTDPIKDRVGQVSAQTDKQAQDIAQQGGTIAQQGGTIQKQGADLERNQTEINANKERAMAADARAGDALKKGDDNARDLS